MASSFAIASEDKDGRGEWTRYKVQGTMEEEKSALAVAVITRFKEFL
jgi:hypothetical protein